MPAWFPGAKDIIEGIRAEAKGSILDIVFRMMTDVIGEAQRNSISISDDLAALKPNLKLLKIAYPADPEAFKPWELITDDIRTLLDAELQHPEGLVVATAELLSRACELSLLGLTNREVIEVLSERALYARTLWHSSLSAS
jgi:hypothetical protein